jgi:hypothetical protein
MIIDCHTHIGRNQHIDFLVDQLLKSMDEAKIDKSLVFAGELNNISNEYLLDAIGPHRDRLMAVAAASPMSRRGGLLGEGVKEEAKIISDLYGEGKIVACKFYTGYDHFYPYDEIIQDYLISFEEIHCPVIFHSGDCLCSANHAKLKYAHPLHIDEVAVDYPGINFIIAHIGFPWHRDAAEVVYKNKNVFADISGFVYGSFGLNSESSFHKMLEEVLDITGNSDKLLFGTDCPISDQSSYVMAASKVLPEDIFCKNPKKAFNFK